jgi:NAD+ synthase (glutamine-hydrolysing)
VRIGLAQINTRVGAIDVNAQQILEAARYARETLHCDLLITPELALSGYPPEDLLLHGGMRRRVQAAFERLRQGIKGIGVVLGYPEYADAGLFNSASLLCDGQILATHRKHVLPNYAVFDEKRYFKPGAEATIVEFGGIRCGLAVCEDVWEPELARATAAAGAQLLLVVNGSPYHIAKQESRERVLAERCREAGLPIVYVNMVGGQDELVFDGGSVAMAADGSVQFRAPAFEAGLFALELSVTPAGVTLVPGARAAALTLEDSVYRALVTGTRDYVDKNGFKGVVLGLSGGVDSALTLCVAVDALGADRVHALMMPSQFTSTMSLEDACVQAGRLGVRYDVLPIGQIVAATLDTLKELFAGRAPDTTEENIQARARGLLLMAISNKLGHMLLSTGNKSEMAVGYATLYGDMAGGFAPLKDCSKVLVYRLARHRNAQGAVIPERVLTRAPTAELRPDQKDSDSLPPYEVLDPILEAFIERDLSVDQIAELGFERATVVRILEMVKHAEYKRRQAPPGVRVSSRAFGRDWRYPITSGY